MELRLGTQETLTDKIDYENKKRELGGEWTGENPEFRNLHWSTYDSHNPKTQPK